MKEKAERKGIKKVKFENAKALVNAGFDIDVICNALNIDKKLVM